MLETWYYMWDTLSASFDMNPMKAPINTHLGKPAEPPNDIVFICIRHFQDPFIIVLHREHIGIDIERSDRDWNYQKLAKIYKNF